MKHSLVTRPSQCLALKRLLGLTFGLFILSYVEGNLTKRFLGSGSGQRSSQGYVNLMAVGSGPIRAIGNFPDFFFGAGAGLGAGQGVFLMRKISALAYILATDGSLAGGLFLFERRGGRCAALIFQLAVPHGH